jgi:thiosulfate/3-mercaptopyruvate sulfurtransferase
MPNVSTFSATPAAIGSPESFLRRDAQGTDVTRAGMALLTRRAALSSLAALAGSALVMACRDEKMVLGPRMAPAALASRMEEVRAGRLSVWHIGPASLHAQHRIPGSRYIGEAGTSEGCSALLAALRALGPHAEVVLYCGCCPTTHCPNVHPADLALREANVERGVVLDLPTNLRTDWIDKGFPVDSA